jgi:hypothetical protein|tara:strand:- start:1011 stop:1217 length:207 start_codon:yes stop_codon:yes gene_type:complete
METQNQITISDLEDLRGIIDLAASRGAFRGAELRPIGELYDKLNGFLQSMMLQAQSQEEVPQQELKGD